MYKGVVFSLTLLWLCVLRGGTAIFRQKKMLDYHVLPGMLKSHAGLGGLWVALMFALVVFPGLLGDYSDVSLYLTACLLLLVARSGYRLFRAKPTAAFVHVGLAAMLGLCVLRLFLKNFWNFLF